MRRLMSVATLPQASEIRLTFVKPECVGVRAHGDTVWDAIHITATWTTKGLIVSVLSFIHDAGVPLDHGKEPLSTSSYACRCWICLIIRLILPETALSFP